MQETDAMSMDQNKPGKLSCCAAGWWLYCFMIMMYVATPGYLYETVNTWNIPTPRKTCTDPCRLTLVESIPENLTFSAGSPSHPSTYDGLISLINSATQSIEIASYYWTLHGSDISYYDSSDWQGESVFKNLVTAGRDRKIKIKIAQDMAQKVNDTKELAESAGAEVRSLNFTHLMSNGILHTKMWLIDRQHFYVGSANLDWRSYTQVKELGAVVMNCSCLAADMGKLFDVYWYLGKPNATIPKHWPDTYSTTINSTHPVQVEFNSTKATAFLSSSPPPFCAGGRSVDIDAIVSVIRQAKQFVHIAVMDYSPTTEFSFPREYWPVIDDELRSAAFRGVRVKLLGSYWKHTKKDMLAYLESLAILSASVKPLIDCQARLFVVPIFSESQYKIPFGRVNHNKYMVTEQTAYIGTSNWSGDYFIDTGGIGFIVNQAGNSTEGNAREQLEQIFWRDWSSVFSKSVTDVKNQLS